jgi:hypothetical protein
VTTFCELIIVIMTITFSTLQLAVIKSRCNNFRVVILGNDMDHDDSQSLRAMHGSGLDAGNTGLKMCAIEAGRQGCVEENASHSFMERHPEKKSDATSNGVNSNGNCFDGSYSRPQYDYFGRTQIHNFSQLFLHFLQILFRM